MEQMREAVARALAKHDRIEICSDASYALSSYGPKADAALSLMQPEIDRRVAEERAKLLERLREPFSDALAAAYDTGATDVHNSWMQDRWGSEADFGEAASDYAASVDVQAMLAQFEKENPDEQA